MMTIGFLIGFAVAFLMALPLGIFIANVGHLKKCANNVRIAMEVGGGGAGGFGTWSGGGKMTTYANDLYGIDANSANAHLATWHFTSTGNSFGPGGGSGGIIGGYEPTYGSGVEVINVNVIKNSDDIIGHYVRIDDMIYTCIDIKYCDRKNKWPLLPGRRIAIIVGK
jgi:hypothetical protein